MYRKSGARQYAVLLVIIILLSSIGIKGDSQKLHSIHQLSVASSLVLVGTISAISPSQVTIGADTVLVTDCTVTVEETIKGTPDASITVRALGGTVGGITMFSSSMPPTYVGQRAIFFLSTESMDRRTLIGNGFGFFQLNSDDTVLNQRGLTLAIIRAQAN